MKRIKKLVEAEERANEENREKNEKIEMWRKKKRQDLFSLGAGVDRIQAPFKMLKIVNTQKSEVRKE